MTVYGTGHVGRPREGSGMAEEVSASPESLVGVEGSECSQRALVLALEQGAGTADASLVVVNSAEAALRSPRSPAATGGRPSDRSAEHLSGGLVADMTARAGEGGADRG